MDNSLISKVRRFDPTHFCYLFGACNCLLLAEGQPLVLDTVDQSENNVSTKTHGKDVDWCVDVPTEPFRELLEYYDWRITWSHEEHVHAFSQTELDEAV